MPRLKVVLLVLVVAGAITAPVARATDYYVAPAPTGNNANPCGQATPCATILHAVGLAANGDTIHLAAGTYPESLALNKRLTFIGAGAGTPSSSTGSSFIHPTASGVGIDLEGGGSLQGLRVRGNDGNGTSAEAIQLKAFGSDTEAYTVNNVIAIGGQDTTAGTSQTAFDISASGTSQIHAVIGGLTASSGLDNGNGMFMSAPSSATSAQVSGSTFDPGSGGFGIYTTAGSLALAESTVKQDTLSIGISASGPLAISRSEIDGANAAISWSNASAFSLVDSLAVASMPNIATRRAVTLKANATTAQTALIQGSTIISRTQSTDQDGLELLAAGAGSTLSTSLVNSVIRDRKTDGTAGPASNADITSSMPSPGGAVSLAASHSSFNTTDAGTGTTLPASGSGTNFAGDPGLTSFAGEAFDLAPTSPLIDQADPAVVGAGELDFAGQPRSVDGNADCVVAPDPGAYELQGHAGSVPPQPIRTAKLARRNESVELETDDNGYTYAWTFSDGGSASGTQVNHRFTKQGQQIATVTATKGTCSASTSKTITIDGTPPKFDRISVKHRKLRFHASEQSSVVVYFFRKSRGRYRLLGHLSLAGHKGLNARKLPKRLGPKARLVDGAYELKLRGNDAAGNHAKVAIKKLRI